MEESRNRAGCWDRRMKRGREREQKKGVGQISAAYLSIFTVQHAILFCDGSLLPYALDFLNAFWRIKAANPGSTQLHLISFPFGSEQFRNNQWMATDAILKIPSQLSPKQKKNKPNKQPHPLTWQLRSRVRACEAAVAALGVGSLLEVPSATAAVSPPASRYNRLKDMGE